MIKKSAKKIKNSSFLILLVASAFLILVLYMFNSGMLLNINSSAGRNRYTATGTLVLSSSNETCSTAYSYGLLSQSSKRCTPLVVSSSVAENFISKDVKLRGALKDEVFYVTSIEALGVGGGDNGYEKPTGSSRPTNPTGDPHPIPLPDPVNGLPKGTPVIEVPPPRY